MMSMRDRLLDSDEVEMRIKEYPRLPCARRYVGTLRIGSVTLLVTGASPDQCAERLLARYGEER